jgi:acyl carrier protein
MELPSVRQVGEFIREWGGISQSERIEEDTQLERDLGITGDDGEELILAIEKQFEISLTRESFNLQANEDLFGPEASLGLFTGIFFSFKKKRIVRPITVGELCNVVRNELQRQKAG